MQTSHSFVAFAGSRLVARGPIDSTLAAAKECLDRGLAEPLLVFEERTGTQIDFDWRGSVGEVLARLDEHPMFGGASRPEKTHNGPGRPKLGVVSREVSLLPRHWEWLEEQSGGISAALRRLVDEARKLHPEREAARRARDAISRIMWAVTGNLPGFEEASRALFAGDAKTFREVIEPWPEDVRGYLSHRSSEALTLEPSAE